MSAYLTALTGAGTAVAVGVVAIVRAWPQPAGQHRGARAFGSVAVQAFRHCPTCQVDTAAVVHADGSHTCTEGHTSRGDQ